MNNESKQSNEYHEVRYLQFEQGGAIRFTRAFLGVLTWPVILPMAMLARISDVVFRSFSEFLSILPYFPGVILRYEFYRFSLDKCGKNVLVEFGAILVYPQIEIGDNVLIGRYNIIHDCDIGSNVLIGERCTFLSGMKQHNYERSDMPITQQGGARKKIVIGDDCWIGSHCVVMENIANGCVVGAGSIVTRPLTDYSIAVGSPARVVRTRSTKN